MGLFKEDDVVRIKSREWMLEQPRLQGKVVSYKDIMEIHRNTILKLGGTIQEIEEVTQGGYILKKVHTEIVMLGRSMELITD